MPTFTYTAKDQKGEVISGSLDAETQTAAAARLQSMGFFPVRIDVQRKKGSGSASAVRGFLPARRLPSSEVAALYRQLADLISAGIPLIKALDIVSSQTAHPVLHEILVNLSADVSAGDTLDSAMKKRPLVFSPLSVAMVRAGEAGGMLDNVLQRLADFAEAEEEVRGKIRSALAYPVIMVIAGSMALAVLLTFVIPKIVGIFTELGQALPLPTQILMGVTGFLGKWWWLLLGAAAAALYGLRRFMRTEDGGRLVHGFILRVPVLGDALLKREIAMFARTLGELTRNGVPILEALDISQKVVRNRLIADAVAKTPESIAQGSGLAAALKDSPYFPPIVINMVLIGEETGQLPESLLKVAHSYELQVDRSMKTLTSLLEPLIILVMGIVIGAIVISMLLPIFSLDPTGGAR